MAARRPGAPLGAQGLRESRSTSSRPAARRASQSRIVIDDFRIDYEMFSDTLPDQYFPKGSNWLMLGPSGRGGCGWRSSICASTAAASASASTWIPAG
jgi:hypothetical protein